MIDYSFNIAISLILIFGIICNIVVAYTKSKKVTAVMFVGIILFGVGALLSLGNTV